MNKKAIIPLAVIMCLISSCATYSVNKGFVKLVSTSTQLKVKVDKEIDQEIYLPESESLLPGGSSIVIVGALANRETLYFTGQLREELGESGSFQVVDSDSLSEFYPSYPCNIISAEVEAHRDTEGRITPGFENHDNRVIREIGENLNVDYVFMVYADRVGKFSTSSASIMSSKETVALLFKIKGTLWDVKADKPVGNSFYYASDSSGMNSGLIIDNYYSKTEELIRDISVQAAKDLSKKLIKEVS